MGLKPLRLLDQKKFRLLLYGLSSLNPFSSHASLHFISKLDKLLSCHIFGIFHINNNAKPLYKSFVDMCIIQKIEEVRKWNQ